MTKILMPVSRYSIGTRFSITDVSVAALSPPLALYPNHLDLLTAKNLPLVASYLAVSLTSSLIAFSTFRIHETIPRFLMIRDVIVLAKATVLGELLTACAFFAALPLSQISGFVLLRHAVMLGTGLLVVRAVVRIGDLRRRMAARPPQHIVLIGLNKSSLRYIEFLRASQAAEYRIIGLLDSRPECIGRIVGGIRVFGPPAQLAFLIEEFAVHGVYTDAVVVCGDPDALPETVIEEVRQVCAHLNINFVSAANGLDKPALPSHGSSVCTHSSFADRVTWDVAVPCYFRYKRFVDLPLTFILIIFLSPLFAIGAALVFFDLGVPVLFWQQRAGLHGRAFLLYKFRTLAPPFDGCGVPIPGGPRPSRIGAFLRKMRFDELPQLFNVLAGDMSLIGPRPLLPIDQPPNPMMRLLVRPGITGWAQVNGGASISAIEKASLDESYIRNASLVLDLRIAWLTMRELLRGNRGTADGLAHPVSAAPANSELRPSHRNQTLLPAVATAGRDRLQDQRSHRPPFASV